MAKAAKRPATAGKSPVTRAKAAPKAAAVKKPVAKAAGKAAVTAKPAKPVAQPTKAKAKVTAKPASKPVVKAKAAAPAKPVAKAKPAVAKAAPAKAAPAKAAPAPAKPATAVQAKPKTGKVEKANAVKAGTKPSINLSQPKPAPAAKARQSALEPKPGVIPSSQPTASAARRKTTSWTASVDDQTDRFEAAKPGTAMYEKAKSTPVIQAGADGSKSPFSPSELRTWRAILLQKRAELADDIVDLRKDAMEVEDGHTTPNHIAERGSDADLQDMSLGMADQEEAILYQLDRAIRKIAAGRPNAYGLCEHTGEPVALSRLELMPWTPLSIQGAEYMESNNLTIEDVLIED